MRGLAETGVLALRLAVRPVRFNLDAFAYLHVQVHSKSARMEAVEGSEGGSGGRAARAGITDVES